MQIVAKPVLKAQKASALKDAGAATVVVVVVVASAAHVQMVRTPRVKASHNNQCDHSNN